MDKLKSVKKSVNKLVNNLVEKQVSKFVGKVRRNFVKERGLGAEREFDQHGLPRSARRR